MDAQEIEERRRKAYDYARINHSEEAFRENFQENLGYFIKYD